MRAATIANIGARIRRLFTIHYPLFIHQAQGRSMFQVTRELHFCYGHRLLHYEGKCRNLHGHNGRAVITLETSALDSLGMVVDFSKIKKVVSAWLDANLDHRMLLHKDDPVLPEL